MSEHIRRTNQSFLNYYNNIDKAINEVSRNIDNLPDDQLTDERYLYLSRQMDQIQNLFDDASAVMKNLELNQSNPDLYNILEKKKSLNERYGFFHRIRSSLTARYEKLHGKQEEQDLDLVRERVMEIPSSDPEEEVPPEEITEEIPEEEFYPDDLDEELAAEEEAAEKRKQNAQRQKRLAKEAQDRQERQQAQQRYAEEQRQIDEQRRFDEQRMRQEQAAQMGMNVNPDKSYSEAELRNERLRQEDARREAEQAAQDRRAREDAAFAEYQRKMEQSQSFEGLDKSHLDYSRNLNDSAPNSPEYQNPSSPEYIPFQPGYEPSAPRHSDTARPQENSYSYEGPAVGFTPSGTAPVYNTGFESGRPFSYETPLSNREIYNRLINQDPSLAYSHSEQRASDPKPVSPEHTPYRPGYEPSAPRHSDTARPQENSYSYEGPAVGFAPSGTAPVYNTGFESGRPFSYETPLSNREIYNRLINQDPSLAYSHSEQRASDPKPVSPEHTPYRPGYEPSAPRHSDTARPQENSYSYEGPAVGFAPSGTAPVYNTGFESGRPFSYETPLSNREIYNRLINQNQPKEYSHSKQSASYSEPEIPKSTPISTSCEPKTTPQHPVSASYTPASSQGSEPIKVPSSSPSRPKPIPVSYAFEEQMRFNVETARLEYEAAKGTPEEKKAVQKYQQERSAYNDFRTAVRNKRFEIEQPAAPAASASAVPPVKGFEPQTSPLHSAPEHHTPGSSQRFEPIRASSSPTQPKPIPVSFAFEEQMRFNVETARLEYEAAKGTPGEKKAVQKYLQERSAYVDFRTAVRNQRFEIEQPTTPGTPASAVPPVKASEPKAMPQHTVSEHHTPASPQRSEPIKASSSPTQPKPIRVSSAFEEQMRFNMEFARLEYEAAKGTPGEKKAVQKYLQERSAYIDFRTAVRNKRFEIEHVSAPAASASAVSPVKGSEKTSHQSAFSAFTPSGIEGCVIDNGRPSGSSFVYNNPGLTTHIRYTAASPMKVSPQYEAQLYSRMKAATDVLNNVVANNKGKPITVSQTAASEIKLATQAYLGFQAAKKAGTVIISEEAENRSPDLRLWQQQYKTKSSDINISQTLGSTGHFVGANPNDFKKATTEEIAVSAFKTNNPLKRQSIASRYYHAIGGYFEHYSMIAASDLSRKIYRIVQSSDESESLQMIENVRYYTSVGLQVAGAVGHARPVQSTAASAAKLANKEYRRFGELTFMDKGTLAKQISEHQKTAMELKKQIKELTSKGLLLTDAEQKQLAQLQWEHMKVSGQLRKEIGFTKYREQNLLTVKAAQSLKAKHGGIITVKHVDDEIARLQQLKHADIKKKFEEIPKGIQKSYQKRFGKFSDEFKKDISMMPFATEKSVLKRIAELEKQNPMLKAQIKLLQKKGSALTAAERIKLKELMAKHKENSILLSRLKGLQAARSKWDAEITPFLNLRKQMLTNKNAWASGYYALQNLLLKPIYEGSETGALGLAKGIQFASNRHIRAFVKNSLKATVFVGKMGVELVAPGTVNAVQTSIAYGKTVMKANVAAAKHTIKTGVVKTVNKYTPQTIKTRVENSTAALNRLKSGINDRIISAKKWFSETRLGRGFNAISRFSSNTAEALRKAFTFVKGVALKGVLIFALVFLIVGVLSMFLTATGSTGSMFIMSPYTTDDGRISLMPYMEILQAKQAQWDSQISALENSGKYDNVVIKYGTSNLYNYKEILSMMAVKMDQDLDLEKNPDIQPYLEHLFDVSHTFSTTESYWECAEGCDTEIVPTTRYCDTDGIYCTERFRTSRICLCFINDCSCNCDCTFLREDDCICANRGRRCWCNCYKYVCQGHPDTKEVPVCRGHLDLYITKYVISFDEIFRADDTGTSIYDSAGIGVFDSSLGGVSAKYEAGGINPGAVSSGAGDAGGKSYGTWQLSSKAGSLRSFITWLNSGEYRTAHTREIYNMLTAHTLASAAFDDAWRQAAADYYSEFQELQARYMYRSYVLPFLQKASNTYGVNFSRSKALIELAFSTSVQFGPNNVKVLGNINSSMTDEQIIRTCYAYKRNNVNTLFKSSSQAVRDSLRRNRFVNEEKDLLSLLGQAYNPGGGSTEETIPDDGRYWNKDRIEMVKLIYDQDWAEFYDVYFAQASGNLSTPMRSAEIDAIIESCKEEYPNLSPEREEVIRTALSIVGKVQYYWGGGHEGSLQPGWNNKWGTPAPASSSPTITYTTWGLDCSGFIRWTFLTAYGRDVQNSTAHGIRQINKAIARSEAIPGDLANVPGSEGRDVHIGMYLYTRADGTRMFVHSGGSGVSLTTEYQSNFRYYHRPNINGF